MPPDKTAAELRQEERDKIMAANKPADIIEEPKTEEDTVVETAAIEEGTENTEVEIETKEDEIEQSEKTKEELEKEKLEAKTAKEKERIEKRINKEVAKTKAAEAEVARLKKELAAKPDDEKVLTEDEVERRSDEKAKLKQLERDFANSCDKLQKEAKKEDKDFDKKVKAMAEDIGPIPAQMIGILDDLDNGGVVLSHLANNVDEMEELYALSPARMALKLAKLSEKIEGEKKTKRDAISKVPKPPDPVNGNKATPEVLRVGMPMDEFVRIRNKQEAEKRKLRFG